MTPTLPATHLLRQFVLFALVVLCLLLLARAGFALWRFPAVEATDSPLQLFVTGLRFDLSLVGLLCIVPLVFGSLLGMFGATRALARFAVRAWLVGALALVLLGELLTPHFILSSGARPDAAAFADLPGLIESLAASVARAPLPGVLGVVLLALILVAYVARMEGARFLRFRLSRPSALALALLGGLVCVALARSSLDPRAPMLSPGAARLGGPPVVDQLARSGAWNVLYTLFAGGAVPDS